MADEELPLELEAQTSEPNVCVARLIRAAENRSLVYSWMESCLEMSWRKKEETEQGTQGHSAVALASTPSWPREPARAVTVAST